MLIGFLIWRMGFLRRYEMWVVYVIWFVVLNWWMWFCVILLVLVVVVLIVFSGIINVW